MEQQFIQQGNVYAAVRAPVPTIMWTARQRTLQRRELLPLPVRLLEKADWAALGEKLDALRAEVLQHAELTVSLYGSEDALENCAPCCRTAALLPRAALHPGKALCAAADTAGERSVYH